MAYQEYHIDRRYKLFGKYYHAPVEGQNANPFLAAHRTFMAAAADAPTSFHLGKFNELDALGIFAADAQDDKYIPLHAHLVVPDDDSTEPYPLAVFIHGQAPTYFDDNDQPMPEVKSYRGYRYLQRYLADHGIASVSVNINIVSFLISGHPNLGPIARLEIPFLVLAMLHQVAGTPVTTDQRIRFQKSDDTLVELQEGLALEATFPSRSSEGRLHNLRNGIAGKLSFTNLGFMGHSRGGTSVHLLERFFQARIGTAPTNVGTAGPSPAGPIMDVAQGPFNELTRNNTQDFQVHHHQYHSIMDLMDVLGNPTMGNLKVIVGLQPGSHYISLHSKTTFYLVLASSHDEDVQEGAMNSYENANCPKAMIFSHGASHGRFNTVWRRLRAKRRALNRQILCQSPIRMLSNRGHENLAKAAVGNAFMAAMKGESHRFLFYTGELRAAIGQDVSRAWKFPFPFAAPPAIKVLDGTALRARNVATSTDIPLVTVDPLRTRQVDSHENYVNMLSVKALTRPASESMVLRIPVVSADSLVTRSHFSFRYTKEYDARDPRARSRVDLRNYTLRLKNGTTTIGSPISGADVPSLHHKAYPTKDHDGSSCLEDTVIMMQTAEVPLAQFLDPEGHPVTDLSQVTMIEIQVDGTTGASGDETWFFVDFVLSTRVVPAAPAGFVIP